MKRFKKIILSICFILAFIFSINIKLFAESGYEINNNGNVESLNLANLNNLQSIQAINSYSYNINNQILTLTQTTTYNDPYIYFNNFITLNEGTYNLYFNSDINEVQYFGLTENNTSNFVKYLPLDNSSTTLTINETTTFGLGFEGNSEINRIYNIKIMISRGNEQLDYFPYGTYYSSSNTLNNNTYLSPFKIDYVESETFYINGILEQGEEPVGYGGTYLFYDIEHTNAQGQNNWKSIVNFNRILPSMTILFKPSGNNFYHLYVYKNEELLYDRAVRYNENYEESDYYLTIPEFNRIELYCDIDNINAPNQEIVLANTYEQGYTYGYSNGYDQGYAEGESSSYGNGYSTGYQKGVREANQNSLYNMILAIVDTPIHIFKGIFDFNVLGINLTNFVLSLVSILIVVWLLKFFL